jgi:hypothetical protein
MIPKPARLELAQHSMGRPFKLSQPYFPRQKSQGSSSPAATMPSWLLSGAARGLRQHRDPEEDRQAHRDCTGTALSYRFVRDTKGWRVFVSLKAQPVEKVTRSQAGAMGMDLNADHLAMLCTALIWPLRKRIVLGT